MRQRLDLPGSRADLSLWWLTNPLQVAAGGPEVAHYIPFDHYELLSPEAIPWLFLHGVQYENPHEVIRDFVQPFLRSALAGNSEPADSAPLIIFASWNSSLVSPSRKATLRTYSIPKRLLFFASRMPWWSHYLRDAEQRASMAAADLLPSLRKLFARTGCGPRVITHSLGAKVWADSLLQILSDAPENFKPGIWWLLQPALPRGVFKAGGEYHKLCKLYQTSQDARSMIWYSRLDIVLATIFVIAKGATALGQYGCRQQSLPQRDVTYLTGGAHGMNVCRRRLGCFFQRSAAQIRQEVIDLGMLV